jgi:hypothetical protein
MCFLPERHFGVRRFIAAFRAACRVQPNQPAVLALAQKSGDESPHSKTTPWHNFSP